MSDVAQFILRTVRDVVPDPPAEVQPGDNFFELGGDSPAAVELMAAVESAYAIEFPIELLFESGDLAPLIAECEARRG